MAETGPATKGVITWSHPFMVTTYYARWSNEASKNQKPTTDTIREALGKLIAVAGEGEIAVHHREDGHETPTWVTGNEVPEAIRSTFAQVVKTGATGARVRLSVSPKVFLDVIGASGNPTVGDELKWVTVELRVTNGPGSTLLLATTLILWGYMPSANFSHRAGNGDALSQGKVLSSDDCTRILRDHFDKILGIGFLMKIVIPILGVVSVSFPSKTDEIDLAPSSLFSARAVVEGGVMSSILGDEAEFPYMLSRMLYGGETYASILEGRYLLFRKVVVEPDQNPETVRPMLFIVPTLRLGTSASAQAAHEVGVSRMSAILSHADIYFSLAAAAHLREVTVIEKDFIALSSKNGPTIEALRNLRSRFEANETLYRSMADRVDRHLSKFSFDSVPPFPSARGTYTTGSYLARAFERKAESVDRTFAQRLSTVVATTQEQLDQKMLALAEAQHRNEQRTLQLEIVVVALIVAEIIIGVLGLIR